jgi:formylglycine-generating enzyme
MSLLYKSFEIASMRKSLIFFLMVMSVAVSSCSREEPENFVFVKGGTFINTKSNFYGKNVMIADFYIGKYEVTQKEWIEVMENNPSKFKGDNLPVEMVSWYDCIEYCNKRSMKEGFKPYFNLNKSKKDPNNINVNDSIKWTVTINEGANGYRLPTEAEWEYAAGGGRMSKSYIFSGSNDADLVAWYWRNSGDSALKGYWYWPVIEKNHNKTKPVGVKKPNELGLYDMSGNVREWCEEWFTSADISIGYLRVQRGGGWLGGEHACVSSYRGKFDANGKGPDQGFRVCRSM